MSGELAREVGEAFDGGPKSFKVEKSCSPHRGTSFGPFLRRFLVSGRVLRLLGQCLGSKFPSSPLGKGKKISSSKVLILSWSFS